MGETLAQLLAADAVVGTRVAQAMTDAARAEPRAGDTVLDSLGAAVAAVAGRRDAHMFIDLLAQLAIERDRVVTLPGAFAAAATTPNAGESRWTPAKGAGV